jgi:hypothetical protein
MRWGVNFQKKTSSNGIKVFEKVRLGGHICIYLVNIRHKINTCPTLINCLDHLRVSKSVGMMGDNVHCFKNKCGIEHVSEHILFVILSKFIYIN